MAAPQISMKDLSDSICEGIVRGTATVVNGFATSADGRHRLASAVQITTDKIHELDLEVGLVKGVLKVLVGSDNDGSSGLVTRMDHDMQSLKTDVTKLNSQMGDLTDNVEKVSKNVDKIIEAQKSQTSWVDGWRGVAFAVVFGAAAVTFIGGIVMAILWLYQHGMPAPGQHAGMG